MKRSALTLPCLAVGVLGLSACHLTAPVPPRPTLTPLIKVATPPLPSLPLPGFSVDPWSDRLIKLLYRGLVRHDLKGKTQLEAATAIESADNQVFSVSLRPDARFSDGEPVTASSFVSAWNSVVYAPSASPHREMFSGIVGFPTMPARTSIAPTTSDVVPPLNFPPLAPGLTPSAFSQGQRVRNLYFEGSPGTLRGLKVQDQHHFTITLVQPDDEFLHKLSHPAFSPLPSAAADRARYATHPVGNGPFEVVGAALAPTGFELTTNRNYRGTDPGKETRIRFMPFTSPQQAADALLKEEIDVTDYLSLDRLPALRDKYPTSLIDQTVGVVYTLNFPVRYPARVTPYTASERRGISQSLRRREIAERILGNPKITSTDYSSHVVDGHSTTLCGDLCVENPTSAPLALATRQRTKTPIPLAFDATTTDPQLMAAMCESITALSHVPCAPRPYPSLTALAAAIVAGSLPGPWVEVNRMAKPSVAGFVVPMMQGGVAAADDRVPASMITALKADSAQRKNASLTLIQLEALRQGYVVPLWQRNAVAGHRPKIGSVLFDVFGQPAFHHLMVKDY